MYIRIIAAISFVTILFFSQNSGAQNNDFLAHGNFEEMRRTDTGTVIEVINPLVIKLEDGRFIHLSGLDYPDLDYYEPGDLSVTALKILDDFLTGKEVAIYQTSSSDKGRTNRLGHHIAQITRLDDDVWVQGMLLSFGVARTRTTAHNSDMATQMLALEDKARQSKQGLWEMDKYAILTPEQATSHIGSYQIIEGVIHNASMNKNRIYLNFGNNWKEDFTASISAFDLKKFTKQKIYPKDWNGKKIRVRGWIESYNGPYMEIDHPKRFEALFEHGTQSSSPKAQTPSTPSNKTDDTILQKGTALPGYNN